MHALRVYYNKIDFNMIFSNNILILKIKNVFMKFFLLMTILPKNCYNKVVSDLLKVFFHLIPKKKKGLIKTP